MKSLTTLIEGAEITPEHLAKNPPKFIPPEHHELWSHLVLKKQHRTYGSAVAHFKHHTKKWGYALTLLTMSVIDEYDPLNENWVDGYWKGSTKDGYPSSYFNADGHMSYPWQKDIPKPRINHIDTILSYGYKRVDDSFSKFKHPVTGYTLERGHGNEYHHNALGRVDSVHIDNLDSHLSKFHSKNESNDDDSAEDAEGKDGDNDGESSAEIGNSEDKGFDNKFNKRYKGRAFGHALRVHRSKEEESMSSVIERAKQILGLSNGMSEAFSKMPGGGVHLPATVNARHHKTSVWSDEFPGIKPDSDWSSRTEIPTGKVTYTKHQHPLVNTLLGHNVGEDTPWVKMPKLDYSYLHSTSDSYKGINKGVALAVSRRDPSHRVLLNHDRTVDLHHLTGNDSKKLQIPDGVGRNEGAGYRSIYSPVHVNKVLTHHFGHSDFDFYKPDYSKSKRQHSYRDIEQKAADLKKHQTGRIQPSVTVGDKFLSTVHSNRHNEIRDNIHAHVNDVMGHINHMLSGGTPQHGEYGRHPAIEKLRNSLNALEDMHDEIRKTHYKGWRGDTGREPMTVDQLLRTRKKATQAATGSDRY